jgi:hypothetical protein
MVIYVDRACNCISDRLSLLVVTYIDRVGIVYLIAGTIYIRYYEKTQFIGYTIPTLSTYFTMRRLSQSDIQYRCLSLLMVTYVNMVGIVYLID